MDTAKKVPSFSQDDFYARMAECSAAFAGRLTLKSLKIAKHLSEETLALTATIYIDGKRVATVRNGGHGGSHETHAVKGQSDAWAAFIAECRAYTEKHHFFGVLDTLIDDAVKLIEDEKRCRTTICFRLPGAPHGQWLEVKWHRLAIGFREQPEAALETFYRWARKNGCLGEHHEAAEILNVTVANRS